MKRTEYTEHIEKIRCSEEFKRKMERQLSAAPQEAHEYEDVVQGVEPAKRFRPNRFAAIAAALVIIAGGVGVSMHGIRNGHMTDPMFSEIQVASDFPYAEIYDLYNSQQIHGTAVYKNVDLADISDFQTGEMTNELLDSLFNNFEMDSWNTVKVKDMADTRGMEDVSFILHPDGYERYTGVYYIFQILENNDAYFIKYDMADDSLSDHIVSEYCYQFTEGTFERYRDILRAENAEDTTIAEGDVTVSADDPQTPPFGSFDSMNVQQIAVSDFVNYELQVVEKEVTETANSEIMDILRSFPWDTVPREDANEENMSTLANGSKNVVAIILDTEKPISILVDSNGKLTTVMEDGSAIIYDSGTAIYDRIREITDGLTAVEPFSGEIASQEEIDSFVEENIDSQLYYHISSPLLEETQGITGSRGTKVMTDNDTVEAIKAKLKSFTWEKGSSFAPYTEGFNDHSREFMWANSENTIYFSENGLLYNSSKSYRLTDTEDIAEIWDILHENIAEESPDFRLTESIINGYNFRNMTGTYSASFTVPAEVSVSGKSFVIESDGTAYVDKENGGIMLEGSGTVSYNNKAETERYAYIKYPDGRERYDEARGEGESTAHYDGYNTLFPMLDYAELYKQVLYDIESYYASESKEFITDEDNSDGSHTYAFKWLKDKEKTTVNVTVNEQGKITSYIKINGDGNVINSFELSDDCVFDSDDFAMPDMYKINNERIIS
ncbi:MAG: hypothetical protein IJ779_00335 [Ruminococcus sp.]|nr:hypothetical protein [Ruminococcus sp.]